MTKKHKNTQYAKGQYITLSIWKTPTWVLLQTVKTQMKWCIMQHFSRVYIVKVKKIFRQKNTIFKKKILPDMYKDYPKFIVPNQKEVYHLYTKG